MHSIHNLSVSPHLQGCKSLSQSLLFAWFYSVRTLPHATVSFSLMIDGVVVELGYPVCTGIPNIDIFVSVQVLHEQVI